MNHQQVTTSCLLRRPEANEGRRILHDALVKATEGDPQPEPYIKCLMELDKIGRIGALELMARIGWVWLESMG